MAVLAQALAADAGNIQAWLQLAGLVDSLEERRFCLSRVLQIDPHNTTAHHELAALPEQVRPRPPADGQCSDAACCVFPGCAAAKSMASYCREHWRAVYRRVAAPVTVPAAPTHHEMLSASSLAERLHVPTAAVLAICTELGWMERGELGWRLTQTGQSLGGLQLYHPQSGVPYVHWPASLLDHPALPRQLLAARGKSTAPNSQGQLALREQQPATLRTADGHLVRASGELAVDNWLFHAGLVHAYERLVPIEVEAYADFYLPTGRIYIEYWGRERSQEYMATTATKRALYAQHHLSLAVVLDDHLSALDACLPVLLAQFGLKV
ncbi:MAG: hypothetical protein H7Z42_07765 [Roseiflexaceae bacterium]|nr:hypothetical protein [Roseiflexaceae bacterium]